MARKVLLDLDPGVADAMALCLALVDPRLEVAAVTATGGNVLPERATLNVQTIVEQLDPRRWPRIGAADTNQPLRTDGREIFGPDGFCGTDFRVAELHHLHASAKVIADEIRAAPGELTIIAGGPLSNLANVFQCEPDLATMVGHLIIVGGTFNGPGNVTAAAEFNIYCDAPSAKLVFRTPVTKTMLPLDVTSQVVLTYGSLGQLPADRSDACKLLQRILPGAFRAYRQRLGLEGIPMHEVVAVAAVLHPELFTTEPMFGDVETGGDLAHGLTVLDRRQVTNSQPNMEVVVSADASSIIDAILRSLQQSL